MSTHRMGKINQLVMEWPQGTVRLASSLNKLGYSKDLLKKYVYSNWLESLGYGAFKLAGDSTGWEGALFALQSQQNSTIHPGGKTVFQLKGYAHYLSQRHTIIFLFGSPQDCLPKWFKNQKWYDTINYSATSSFDYSSKIYFSELELGNFNIRISSLELAALEMLYLVPQQQSFDEALQLLEGLTTLRPKILQSLLEKCKSVKVKRLFLYMAEKNNHTWFKDLNLKRINLGSGKRVIVKDGNLDKRYNITVTR